ncbi:sensor histidine kinase [Fodinicurvata sediminis]|uniref:sensor histidine kinase n=1 Tax=Fodinicurvata sediminis TaxID=1121832 RepID=UPI0003B422CF|nr:ATP-binding protein [Fodinicurvata sediminis]
MVDTTEARRRAYNFGLITVRAQLFPIFVLVAVFLVVAAALIYNTVQEQNRVAEQTALQIVSSTISEQREKLSDFVEDYAYWDATVENLVSSYDPKWADDNVGQWVVDGLGMDGSLAVGANNRIIHHTESDALAVPEHLPEPVNKLVIAARAQAVGRGSEDSKAVTGFFRDKEGLHLAAASVVNWEGTRPLPRDDGAPVVLIFFQTFDQDLLSTIDYPFLLKDMHLSLDSAQASGSQLPLRSVEGNILGILNWESAKPANAILKQLYIPLLLEALIMMLVFGIIIQRAYKRAQLFHEYHNWLESQTKELREARNSAEALSKSKSEFLAMMSHELRTPLNAIIGFSDLIRQEYSRSLPVEQIQGYAQDIHASGNYLLGLINDILDMSKIEAQRYELHESEIELSDLLEQSLVLVKRLAGQKSISIEMPTEDYLIHVDIRALTQVVVNILSNAIKFSHPGTSIQIKSRENVDGSLSLLISDQGIGMSDEDVRKALEPFGQAKDAYLSNTSKGTGLGLNISEALMNLHNGSLTIRSVPGTGTTVELRLPADRISSCLDYSTSQNTAPRLARSSG